MSGQVEKLREVVIEEAKRLAACVLGAGPISVYEADDLCIAVRALARLEKQKANGTQTEVL